MSLGTGKTTTLLEYARLRPHVKFLLVVYNRWVKEKVNRTLMTWTAPVLSY